MSHETKPVNAMQTNQLLRSAPYFVVADIEQSAAHYEHVLGSRREYAGGAPPQFVIFQEAYQMEEFAVRDRDGYVLGFGQSLR